MWREALHNKIQKIGLPIVVGVVCFFVSSIGVIVYYKHTSTHLPPNIYINSIAVGNLTYQEAQDTLLRETGIPPQYEVTLDADGITATTTSEDLGLAYNNYQDTITTIKNNTSTGRMRDRIYWRFKPLFSAMHFEVNPTYDPTKLEAFVSELNDAFAYEGQEPSATLGISQNKNTLTIFPGKKGRTINIEATKDVVQSAIVDQKTAIKALVASTSAELTQEQALEAQERAEKLIGKSIKSTYNNRDYTINDKELISFVKLPTGYNRDLIAAKVATFAAQIDRVPQEPVFEYNTETLAVTKFSAPLNGQSLDKNQTESQILTAVQTLESAELSEENKTPEPPIALIVSTTPPKKSLADTNDIGIKEKIGFGDSRYDHSIPNRIHNVALTTERISNIIVPPGAEYSFNKTLGDVSAATGFRSAYVIKNGQTELGDGGGVCQVSTTLFRAVLNAGLQITRRLPHSYRVSYYELNSKPGVDATVYTGNTDFRFINDTPGHILIHAEADSKNLYMYIDIYGTSDGRTTEIKDHITWNLRPALAPQYFPDPTLPAGKLVQIDWAATGISASFINVIKDKNGKVIREDKYVSNYRPWAAKYRQGIAQ